jgi:PGF-CTERM protein
VANITGARPGEIRGDGFSVVRMSRSSITLRAADFNERVEKGDSRIGLGRVLFNDTYGGRSDISVTVDTLRDDNNSVFDASTSNGELIISGGTPRSTATATPTDTPTTTSTPTPTTTSTPTPTTISTPTTTSDATTADDGDSDDTPAGDTGTPAENTIPPAEGADGNDGGDGGGDGGDTATDTSSGGGPGFTVGLALVALAGVALLARRRD